MEIIRTLTHTTVPNHPRYEGTAVDPRTLQEREHIVAQQRLDVPVEKSPLYIVEFALGDIDPRYAKPFQCQVIGKAANGLIPVEYQEATLEIPIDPFHVNMTDSRFVFASIVNFFLERSIKRMV